jgi:hypothetical protein
MPVKGKEKREREIQKVEKGLTRQKDVGREIERERILSCSGSPLIIKGLITLAFLMCV